MNLLVASLLVVTLSSSMQINPEIIEDVRANNPKDITSRMLLARYYYDLNQFDKAQVYLDEALKIDKSLVDAKKLKSQIAAFSSSKEVLASADVKKPYNKENLSRAIVSLHEQQKYLEQVSIYEVAQVSNISLEDKSLLLTARYFIWDGQYDRAENAIKQIVEKTSIDYLEEYGKLCSLTEKYDCAIKAFNMLYSATQNQKYGMTLFKLYWSAGRYSEAERLFYQLRSRHPKKGNLSEFDNQIAELREKRIAALKQAYENEPSLEHFLAYISGLSETDQADKAGLLIEKYLSENVKDPNVHFELATRLSWLGQNDRAIEILQALLPSEDKKISLRLGEIYAWGGQFEQAINVLTPLTESSDKEVVIVATRTLAYTYLWSSTNDKARHYFRKTLTLSPKDTVAKEELMILDGDVKPLLKKYLTKHKRNKTDVDTIRRLVSFYQLLKDQKNALVYLEKLNRIQPGNLNTQKELGEGLVADKQHYRGFGLLEKYAYQKNTSDALFHLAQQYYWAGFNDEAKDVLDDLLRRFPDFQKAYDLKAEILKSNPRFVSDKNSQSGWQKYEKDKSGKQIELADRLYFAEFYKSSIPYYEEYLKVVPDDYDARYRYAFALQHAKMHREAAGEFYLMFWQKKNIELRYHYAYNLELMGRTEEAYKEYLQILDEHPKSIPSFLNVFLSNWEKAWEAKDLSAYSSFYGAKQSKNASWRIRKELSFKNSSFIAVAIKEPMLITQKEGQYTVRFFQEFASNRIKDSGYKTLQIKCKKYHCFITKERWKSGDYAPKNNAVYGYVKERIVRLESELFKISTSVTNDDVVNDSTRQTTSNLQLPKPISGSQDLQSAITSGNDVPQNLDTQVMSLQEVTSLQEQIASLKAEMNTVKEQLRNAEIRRKLVAEIVSQSYLPQQKKNQQIIKPVTVKKNREHSHDHSVKVEAQSYRDVNDVDFKSVTLSYSQRLNEDLKVSAAISQFELKDKDGREDGKTLKADLSTERFTIGARLDKLEDYDETSFYGAYRQSIGEHYLNFEIDRVPLPVVKYSVCSARNKLHATRIRATDYTEWQDKSMFWGAIDIMKVNDDNQNTIITPQFDYRFGHHQTGNISTNFSTSGWYQANSEQSDCYYSPEFFDSTYLGFHFDYSINNDWLLKTKASVGYSFSDETELYQYGVWIENAFDGNLGTRLGCYKSNSVGEGGAVGAYGYYECQAALRYDF